MQLFAQTLPAGFWRYWAGVLMQRSSGPKLLTVSDLATTTLPPRGRQVSDPVIERIIASRYDSRHSDYYRTISSWGHYSTRPIDDARAQALGAMSASTFLLDDLFDGWETVEAGLDASEVVASQERMVDALGRRPSIEPPGSPEERDVIDAVRRASDLCHAVRPNDVWWDDYVREASGYVYGRGISSFLATRRLLLSPELYLRARTLDVGAIAGTTFSSLAVAAYPEQRDFLVEPWGLGWLHLLATNDLYSYYRERDESTFNLVHVVHAAQSELVPTSVAQAVDAVVRLCNLLQDRLEQLTEELALEWGPRSTVGRHIEAFCWAPTGGLDFLRAHPHRYRDPATLSDYDVELCGVVDAYRQSWWHPSHWDAVQRFIAPHRVTALCSSAWQFALAGAEPRPTTYATAVPYAVADTRASWRPQA